MKSLEYLKKNPGAWRVAREIDDVEAEYDAMAETARSRFESLQSAEAKCQELAAQLAAMKQERDDIQLRLHAVDHAYNEQQRTIFPGAPLIGVGRKAQAELDKAMDTIRRQREFIRTLYTSRNKPKKAKPAQTCWVLTCTACGKETRFPEARSVASCSVCNHRHVMKL